MQGVIMFGCGMQSGTHAPGLSDQTPVGPEMDPEMPQCSGDPETPGGNALAFVHVLSQPPDTCLGLRGGGGGRRLWLWLNHRADHACHFGVFGELQNRACRRRQPRCPNLSRVLETAPRQGRGQFPGHLLCARQWWWDRWTHSWMTSRGSR